MKKLSKVLISLMAIGTFAFAGSTTSDVEVSTAYEPGCTISLPNAIDIGDISSISKDDTDGAATISSLFDKDGVINGTVNCAKDLAVTATAIVAEGEGRSTVMTTGDQAANSGTFKITGTADANDNGVYRIAIAPKTITVDDVVASDYLTQAYPGFSGAGEDTPIVVALNVTPEDCLIRANGDSNCPAGSIEGSMTVTLNW